MLEQPDTWKPLDAEVAFSDMEDAAEGITAQPPNPTSTTIPNLPVDWQAGTLHEKIFGGTLTPFFEAADGISWRHVLRTDGRCMAVACEDARGYVSSEQLETLRLSYPPASRGREWNLQIPHSPRARTHAGTSAETSWRLYGFRTRPRPAGGSGICRFLFLRVRDARGYGARGQAPLRVVPVKRNSGNHSGCRRLARCRSLVAACRRLAHPRHPRPPAGRPCRP